MASEPGTDAGEAQRPPGSSRSSRSSGGGPEPAPEVGGTLLGVLRRRWRGWLRAIHRDLGYLAVGLTIIYAISGLAINHIGRPGWDPNFHSYERERQIAPISLDTPDDVALAQAEAALHVGTPRSWYRAGDELRLEYDYKQFVVIGDNGKVIEQGRKPRFFLRVANWLHYNRGKKAWTYVADGYAVLLLYLAISGLFMIKGKKGLRWRGAALAAAGISVPIAYVAWSGGPEAALHAPAKPAAEATGAPPPSAEPPSDEPPAGEPAEPADDFPRMQPRKPPPPAATTPGAPPPQP
ncbi:MAG TPA: hypothetical protein VHE35_29805 [Kofleriaceae bacterium]|nr:hypothetical protein [Kofleriaceae bacterium]